MRLFAIGLAATALSLALGMAGPGATHPQRRSAGPGLGLSTAAPEGDPFTLPAGVTLENPILAYSPDDPIECEEKYPEPEARNGSAVALCLAFRNSTSAPIDVTLPPGLLFVSTSDKVQSGFLVQRLTIEVPPGVRYVSPLLLHCANIDRNTSTQRDEYTLGPIVQYKAFQEFYALLEGKDVSGDEVALVQLAINHLAEGEGLSASDREALESM